MLGFNRIVMQKVKEAYEKGFETGKKANLGKPLDVHKASYLYKSGRCEALSDQQVMRSASDGSVGTWEISEVQELEGEVDRLELEVERLTAENERLKAKSDFSGLCGQQLLAEYRVSERVAEMRRAAKDSQRIEEMLQQIKSDLCGDERA